MAAEGPLSLLCVYPNYIPPPREAERQFRTLLSVQPGLLSRGATQQKNCMDAWLKQQAWDPLPRLQLLVSQQETVIFYTEPTGLSALCCWVAGALQQGLLWFQVAFWNRKRATPETAKPQWDQPHSSFNPCIGIIFFFLNTELYQNMEQWFALSRSKSPMKLNCQGAEHSTELSSSVKPFWTANINTIHLQIHQNSATHNEEESADTGVEIDHVDKNI